MLHVTIALHKGLNGPLTGTGAMEAPGAGASMTLEVDFQTPGQEGTHHMSMPIGKLSPFSLGFHIWRRFCCTIVFPVLVFALRLSLAEIRPRLCSSTRLAPSCGHSVGAEGGFVFRI